MALTQTYVGTTTVGASAQTPASNTAYAKQVTVPANSVLSSVEAHLALTDGNAIAYRVAVWSDNAGALNDLLRLWTPTINMAVVGGTDRWLGGPVGIWFGSETDVWIGIQLFDPASSTLSYETSGGTDVTVATGSTWTGEAGASGTTVTVTNDDFSIRGLVIS